MYDGNKLYKYMKPCLDHNILIYPKPQSSNGGRYKIVIERNGKPKVGSEIYKNELSYKKVQKQGKTGFEEVKVEVPSIWDKIFQLYREIAIKNKYVIE